MLFFAGWIINNHFNIYNAIVKSSVVIIIDVLTVKVVISVPFHHLVKLIAVVGQAIHIITSAGLHVRKTPAIDAVQCLNFRVADTVLYIPDPEHLPLFGGKRKESFFVFSFDIAFYSCLYVPFIT